MIKKMIAVWGSNGSGKSCASIAIATTLARYGNNVLVVNTSTLVPHLPIFIPSVNLSGENSIGSLLAGKNISEQTLRNKINIHPQSDKIGIMAMANKENPFTYGDFEKENIFDFFKIVNDTPFDYIIFDCESNPIYDVTTLFALELADVKLQLITPNIKGAEFIKTQASYLKNESKYGFEKHIKIISPTYKDTPTHLIGELLGGYDFYLPFAKEVDNAFSSGYLMSNFTQKDGITYLNNITKLVKERILIE